MQHGPHTQPKARSIGRETRLALQREVLHLDSVLPQPQADCMGWHLQLPADAATTFKVGPQTTWGEWIAAAVETHSAPADAVALFTPREMGCGLVCDCGHRDGHTWGQVSRTVCPGCGRAGEASPLSVNHFARLAALPAAQPIAASGLPRFDLLWTLQAGLPESAWRPWRLGPPLHRVTDEPRIGVLGLGALGWPTAQSLVRLGYRALDLVDMDTVEPHNVGVIFDTTAVGRAKVEVAQQQLKAIDPEAEPAAWHGDLVHDLPLSVIAGWDAAVMALDRNSAKIPATQYLELLGVPYVQGQIDGASATALVRTYVPGQTCCLICLLSPQEMEFEVEFSCLRRRTDHGTGRPRLFTTAIEAQLGAALIAWRIRELVPPVPRSSPGPDAATSASDESGPEGARREGSLAAVVG